MFPHTIGFLGAGHLNGSLIAGLLKEELFLPQKIIASCQSQATAKRISADYKIKCSTNNSDLIEMADCIIVGVRPNQLKNILDELAQLDLSNKLIISVAAGITCEAIEKVIGEGTAIVRAMPNIAANFQASLTGIFTEVELNDDEIALIETIFSTVGGVEWLEDETQLDGIIALSSSGIALMFRVFQSMAKAGERYGFEPEILYDIISQTAFGASVLALEDEKNDNFSTFVQTIATPNGTTAAGLAVLNASNLDEILDNAMQAIVARSQQISDELTKDW